MVFRETVDFSASPSVPASHEQWMGILSPDAGGKGFLLCQFSSTGFITRYHASAEKAVIHFYPEGGELAPSGWLFRRTLTRTSDSEITESVDAAPPDKPFFNYDTLRFARAAPAPAASPAPKSGALKNYEREEGPKGFIGFAISARMSEGLHAALLAVPAEAWQSTGEDPEVIRECAEVAYVPSEKTEKKDQQPLRYVGIRLRKRQGELFGDGTAVKHFAVVSNIWEWSAPRLLEWHRQKAGTIEMVHDILKNDLAAGVLPCGRFGAELKEESLSTDLRGGFWSAPDPQQASLLRKPAGSAEAGGRGLRPRQPPARRNPDGSPMLSSLPAGSFCQPRKPLSTDWGMGWCVSWNRRTARTHRPRHQLTRRERGANQPSLPGG